MKVFLAIVAILGCAQASILPMTKDEVAKVFGTGSVEERQHILDDASGLFDQTMAVTRDRMFSTGMNSIAVPDLNFTFSGGDAEMWNGALMKMDSIHRTGIADITVEPNGDLVISTEIGVNEAVIHYEILAHYLGLSPQGVVDGKLSRVRILMVIRVDFSAMVVHLQTFDIRDTGSMSVSISGLGAVLDFLVEIVVNLLGNLIKGIVVELLEGTIKNFINSILTDIFFTPGLYAGIRAAQNFGSLTF